MKSFRARAVALVVVASACAALPASASAATKFRFTQSSGKLTGNTATGTISGGTFGKGTVTGKVTPPTASYTFKFKGGTIKMSFNATDIEGSHIAGPIKLTGGTGKYAHIKGSGTCSGDQLKGTFVFKGTYSK
jgi:hypothetical protein